MENLGETKHDCYFKHNNGEADINSFAAPKNLLDHQKALHKQMSPDLVDCEEHGLKI